jgi:hypothetical protein
MDHFAGFVSVKETSVCILDDAGKILKEVKVASEPQALLKVLGNLHRHLGSLSADLLYGRASAAIAVPRSPRNRMLIDAALLTRMPNAPAVATRAHSDSVSAQSPSMKVNPLSRAMASPARRWRSRIVLRAP